LNDEYMIIIYKTAYEEDTFRNDKI